MNYAKSACYHPSVPGVRRLITRSGLASFLAIVCTVAMAANVLADNPQTRKCYDSTNGVNYVSIGGPNPPALPVPFWYAEIYTNNFTTYGIKGNISTGGQPYTFNNTNEHVDDYLSEQEYSTTDMRWIQVGWHIGQIQDCWNNSNASNVLDVYIEIYDDSSNPCTIGLVTGAPSIASYDTRYYAQVGSLYRYHIYFEVPGSNNIQDLGWGDYHSHTNEAVAAGEALADAGSGPPWPMCPELGQIESNHWNYFGQQASQPTFAAELQLYNSNGSWSDWTSSTPTTVRQTPPYQIQLISSYSEFKNGGGQE